MPGLATVRRHSRQYSCPARCTQSFHLPHPNSLRIGVVVQVRDIGRIDVVKYSRLPIVGP